MIADFRSDTVTKPTPAMLQAMLQAPVGDDVFDEDPTVNALQEKVADLFGHEAALFCASGTMTNQIAIKVHTRPMDEVICDELAHVYNYEGGGIAFNSGASVKLIRGDRGRITAEQVAAAIQPDNVHHPRTSLVCVENTCNRGGGGYYALPQLAAISDLCRDKGLAYHMDGARLFNALAETGDTTRQIGNLFHSISLCLSKGLGAPVGSVLSGSHAFIKEAKRVRKVFGGGMRQAGILAAAGIYALDNHVDRLKEDHLRAAQLGNLLQELSWVQELLPVHTNIVVFRLFDQATADACRQHLRQHGVLVVPFGPAALRMVTHLDINDDHMAQAMRALQLFRP